METTKNHSVILSTAYLPNLEYFARLISGKALLEQHENYVKQTYRNRCEILTAHGVMPLIIPVKHAGKKIGIRDVKIDYTGNWQKMHWRTIRAAYMSSPFFEYYIDDLLPFYEFKDTFLFDFNWKLLGKLLELMGIKTEISFTESYLPQYEFDYRMSISPKNPATAPDTKPYYQVFGDKFGFQANLSILDLLCNEGNNAFKLMNN
jgi:hypothetical protein